MPELPEVETVKRGLNELLIDKQVKSVSSDWPKSFQASKATLQKFVVGAQIAEIKRVGKLLIIGLSSDYSLLVHLKMTGQLVFDDKSSRFGAGHPNDSLLSKLPDSSTRVIITFTDGSRLFFNDQRKFGWIKVVVTALIDEVDFISSLGPDVIDGDLDEAKFLNRLRRRDQSMVKAVLLDQKVIAGVGNIYADEALYLSRIHPQTKVVQLSDEEIYTLYKELVAVMNLSIEQGGSTDRNYRDAKGRMGSYLKFAKVFRREGQDCERDGTIIKKIRVAGRGTHICPVCQKLK